MTVDANSLRYLPRIEQELRPVVCEQRQQTDRFKENYSIDEILVHRPVTMTVRISASFSCSITGVV